MSIITSIPYFSEEQLTGLGLTTHEVIDSIEALILSGDKQNAWSAPKAVIQPGDGRYMMAALAAADEPSVLAVKTVILNPRNPEQGLPLINGLVTLLDSHSGLPIAILDGNWITAVRTAGLSATAARHMANKDASVIAFIGCGVQANSHLQAFSTLFPLEKVQLFGRGRMNIERLGAKAAELSLPSVACNTAEEAVTGADIVISSVTHTGGVAPFLDADWLKPGAFAAITDLAVPWIKQSFSALDQVIIDDMAQEAAMPNKLMPPDYVTGDLSQLVLGKLKGRNRDCDRNAFVFRGHAMGDLALSALVYQRTLMRSD
ncbi:ornithine cyclodeaminase family protein [Kistimonas asteriae]|uniref:ornithine cyclodeaminase family protein n=1 Tax=Kistimonas asteriae TaxID=517724 RepID=UPI001BA88E02|nr:ornithine cyclodeaminase family protein [Kistimonas asteriae]